MNKRVVVFILILGCLILSACSPAQTASPSLPPKLSATPEPSDTPAPTPTQAPSLTPPPPTDTPLPGLEVQLRFSTSSDWSTLALVEGGDLRQPVVVSSSAAADFAGLDERRLLLNQSIQRAEAGETVEMVAESRLNLAEGGEVLVFEIDRGHIGLSRVEVVKILDGEPVVIAAFEWGGIAEGERNVKQFRLPVAKLLSEHAPTPAPLAARAEPVAPISGLPQGTDGYAWWNDSVFYEIFVRSFYDSDGDGIGDLNGIRQKLDYLNDGDPTTTRDLGVTGIWLSPISPSPAWHGYAVTDYTAVNPEYGTLQDLKLLVEEAHARGMRVILDLVLNHTASQHDWFVSAENPNSPYHDWYVWSDEDPGYSGSWGQQVWFPLNEDWYYSLMSAYLPDLNYNNPQVNAEMLEVARFWLEDVGVDGYRLDAAKHMIEEGVNQVNTPSTHAWWENFRLFYKQINPQAMTVGEIWDDTPVMAEYLQGDEFDLSFEFYLAAYFVEALNIADASKVNERIELAGSLIPPLQYAVFLTNHDMERLMTQLEADPEKVKAAASLMLTAPGVPFLYYGEEVGMQSNQTGKGARLPMQWSAEPNAGFSTHTAWEAPGPGWESYTVEGQMDDRGSMLSHYRDLIRARNQHAALRVGEGYPVDTMNNAIYSILRVSEQEAVLVLVNLSGETIYDYALTLEESSLEPGSYTPAAILGSGGFAPLEVKSSGGFAGYMPVDTIPAYGTLILQLQPAEQ